MSRHQPVSSFERAAFHRKGSAGLDFGALNLTALAPSSTVAAPSTLLYTPPESRPIAEGLQGITDVAKFASRPPRIGGYVYPSSDPAALEFTNIALLPEPSRSALLGLVRGFYNPVTHKMSESNEVMRQDGVRGAIDPSFENYGWIWQLYQAARDLDSTTDSVRSAAAHELDQLAAFGFAFIIPWGSKWRAIPASVDSGLIKVYIAVDPATVLLSSSRGLSCTQAMLSADRLAPWPGLTSDQIATLYWYFRNGKTILNPAYDAEVAKYVASNIAHAIWRESDFRPGRERIDCFYSNWV